MTSVQNEKQTIKQIKKQIKKQKQKTRKYNLIKQNPTLMKTIFCMSSNEHKVENAVNIPLYFNNNYNNYFGKKLGNQ